MTYPIPVGQSITAHHWPPPPPPPPPYGPTLFALLPSSGPSAGGNYVLLFGQGLDGVTQVTFDGLQAPIVSDPHSDFVLVVTAPPHVPGTVPVTVITYNGTSNSLDYT